MEEVLYAAFGSLSCLLGLPPFPRLSALLAGGRAVGVCGEVESERVALVNQEQSPILTQDARVSSAQLLMVKR